MLIMHEVSKNIGQSELWNGSVEMEVVCSTKVPVQTHYTTRCNNQEDHYLNKTHSKNLKIASFNLIEV